MSAPDEIAAEVIAAEIEGLAALSQLLSARDGDFAEAFAAATSLCENAAGRVIVTGMGKSGHVARKIAATFASTGTPASFVHPAEASHGDLGMIARDDLILALSLSGETAELGDIVAHAGRFDIPMIAMTAGAKSALAEAGDVVLLLPAVREACDATPAPTTSTTMMMALGDALAVAVLRRKGFSATEFKDFHPGGKLGASLKRATDLMHHRDLPLCRPEDAIDEAVAIVTKRGFGCVGVIDETARLIGIVTDGDLRRHFKESLDGALVRDVMTRDPHVVTETSLAGEVLGLFAQRKITAVFIVDGAGKPVGLVHVHDCLATGVI